jgi:hypothetical protein
LLTAARQRFERDLPVDRPLTEPDIALHLPGEYLVLIEAKFTSPNPYYVRGPRRQPQDLTVDELLTIYWDDGLTLLDWDMARRQDRIFHQLWRNTVFAEWMAKQDDLRTRAYHVNLVREGHEEGAGQEFPPLLREVHADRFKHVTWEQLYEVANHHCPRLDRLCRYMEEKTEGLRRAFRVRPPE